MAILFIIIIEYNACFPNRQNTSGDSPDNRSYCYSYFVPQSVYNNQPHSKMVVTV